MAESPDFRRDRDTRHDHTFGRENEGLDSAGKGSSTGKDTVLVDVDKLRKSLTTKHGYTIPDDDGGAQLKNKGAHTSITLTAQASAAISRDKLSN
eukprot:CAMPEP_0185573430 /NCGR_PEP_ID=MMETSP0434-20130131/5143_1 /TAXON_ID=626734 ORGANISM="Favella taraikaensis, Strain Fe Narragansett Bay" /NCGR_SAMPLE_ID=MMETSP0434 /ASSEMBLY_ACC=CAM_ASM_000379 /LENGTH=94 /DNA_ID=CAMNT_0028189647 /DNA_START=262 /DNA_END=546 /DNA_ORIENTATION=+